MGVTGLSPGVSDNQREKGAGNLMGWFDRTRPYDRSRILDAAANARARKKRKRAIALYRQVLAVERNNAELHERIAPLLAETGQHFDAWVSFRIAARAWLRKGRGEKALSIYREAAGYLPREVQVWQAIARLQIKLAKKRDAVQTLLEGACQFRPRRHRPEAVHLLRRAHEIAPWDFEVVSELARLLAKSDQFHEARRFLEGLEARTGGDRLRRVYAAQFRLDGDLRYAWLWLHAAVRREPANSYG
jgi:tetratricopeptide (TPR) repeat protein